jgi:hypothetical protein
MTLTLRAATSQEWERYARRRPSHVRPLWSAILECNGEVVGHGFISEIDGTTWLHDLEVWSIDKTAAARIYLAGRKYLRQAGRTDVYTHVKAGSPTHELYKRHGFAEGELVLRGDVS